MNEMTPKAIAVELETDPKTLRRFLRSIVPPDARPGKGAKWAIDADALPTLRIRFAEWSNRSARTITIDDLTDPEIEQAERGTRHP